MSKLCTTYFESDQVYKAALSKTGLPGLTIHCNVGEEAVIGDVEEEPVIGETDCYLCMAKFANLESLCENLRIVHVQVHVPAVYLFVWRPVVSETRFPVLSRESSGNETPIGNQLIIHTKYY